MYSDFESLKQALAKNNQTHILSKFDVNNSTHVNYLLDTFSSLNVDKYCQSIQSNLNSEKREKEFFLPPRSQDFCSHDDLSKEELNELAEIGLKALSENKVAVILLSGGQGTRLGVDYPKGMFNVGLPSEKSLFQLQAERLSALAKLVEKKFNKRCRIQWYIMTSDFTCDQARDFFNSNNNFGFPQSDIIFFEQFTVPSVSFEGKFLMRTDTRLAQSPDGNGGIYRALRERGILKDMANKGIEHIHVYCVDNILIRMADPEFIGYCIKSKADCGVKTVEKKNPYESVGVVGLANNLNRIIEYSEITNELAEAKDPSHPDKLLFRAGSICIFYFNKKFIDMMATEEFETKIPFHFAKKVIPIWDGEKTVKPTEPNGFKLEKFIFDVFPFAKKLAIWNVDRKDNFSALKNPSCKLTECPETSRKSLLDQHKRYAERAGAIFTNDDSILEIDPAVSLFGENLEFMNNVRLSGINRATMNVKNQPVIHQIK